MKFLLVFFCQLFISFLFCQGDTNPFLEGTLKDGGTKETLPFAKIYNKTLKKGTISDDSGFFQIDIASDTDNIIVTYIGYPTQSLFYNRLITVQDYFIERNVLQKEEVKIYPLDLPFLYVLLGNCKTNASTLESTGKAIYELKSFMDNDQIELVEGYYNFESKGYDLNRLDLKTARLGIQSKDDKTFVSIESSRAISSQRVLYDNEFFPQNPLEFRPKKMREKFSLRLVSKYLDDNRDSIYIILYQPRLSNGQYFSGSIWVNKTKNNILKIETNCTDCKRHPFIPLTPSDTIQQLDLAITRTFREVNGQMGFEHVDFNYHIKYKSRFAGAIGTDYNVSTKAVIHAYAFDEGFHLPLFSFSDENIGDYRKINAIPYNSFFWEMNDEEKMADRKNSNQLFYKDTLTLRSGVLFRDNIYFRKGLLEHPYRTWSNNRLIFREFEEQAKEELQPLIRSVNGTNAVGPKYHLSVKVFADYNSYQDSANILTATIFDPYESFTKLPSNPNTNCFINMYFDIYEIGRRLFLESLINKELNPKNFETYYTQFFAQFDLTAKEFLRDVEQGANEEKMRKWNDFIKASLQIDNIEIFRVFVDEESQE